MYKQGINSYTALAILFLLLFSIPGIYAQSRGGVKGSIQDAQSGEPLMYANVALKGTTTGTVTDDNGNYQLSNAKPGKYTLVFSYLSYHDIEQEIEIKAGEMMVLNGSMEMKSIMGEEVVITAMMRGQTAAINQQVNSNTIVNVVSKEKIMELPDQNAAETVARLPGVSLVRDGGEGTKVTLRGMAPRFNTITIDGEKIPSTSDQDRSVDLSMFSTDALAGIEYYKALLPDMDGDAIGGLINFTSRTASGGFHGNARMQTGYNHLSKAFGQYKGSVFFENRFFNDRLGVIAGGGMQKAERSSEGYTGDYATELGKDGDGNTIFTVSKLNVTDKQETRYRYNANTTVDLKLDNGSILFSSNFGQTNREEIRRRRRYRVDASYQEHDIRERYSDNLVLSSRLSGKHRLFSLLELDWAGSYSLSRNKKPFVSTMRFRELGAFNSSPELTYEQIINSAKNNMDATWLKWVYFDNYDVKDDNYSLQANAKLPFILGNQVQGYVKAGGKYRHKYRVNDIDRIWTQHFVGKDIIGDGREQPDWDINYIEEWVLMSNFLGDYYADDFARFFDSRFYLGPGPGEVNGPHLDEEKVEAFRMEYADYYVPDPTKDLSDYEAGENITAGYAMAGLTLFNRIDLIAGARYERTQNSYRSVFGSPKVDEDGNVENTTGLVDTVGNRVLEQWLPMFHLKFDLFEWANLRLAATKSLNRPNFFSLVPWEIVNWGESYAERGEPNLKHMSAWNYDAILSFFGKFGLFSIGGFYKEVENIDYTLSSRIFDPEDPIYGLYLTRPVNAEGVSTILGFEVDVQSNFRFLPSPFNGIVISANYTHLQSETLFPISIIETMDAFPYTSTVRDTVRSGNMPGQVDDLINLSIGYERKSFSARVSMIYQGESLFVDEEAEMGRLARSIGTTPEKDNFVGSTIRWDLVLKQKIKDHFQLFLYVNNFTNVKEQTYIAGSVNQLLTSNIMYGMTVDVGLTYKF
ncbi:MAG: TonB-dependent receptor [Bacteroidales bacterium]|nr:TonB-dependent receptor [Bacteroidales bacterium]